MGRIKDYLMDLEEGVFEKNWKIGVKQDLIKGRTDIDCEVDTFTAHFIREVCGSLEDGQYHSLRLIAPEGWCVSERCYDDNELLEHIALGTSLGEYNVFYSPATFLRKEKEKENVKWNGADKDHLHHIQCLYIDIDGLDFDVRPLFKLNNDQFAAWIHEKFDWSLDMMPNFIVSSGHGMHLYWCLREPVYVADENNFEKWKSGIGQLIAKFKADSHCKNATRVLRAPGTFNLKNGEKIPVLLYELAKEKYSLNQFENVCSENEINAYLAEIKEKKSQQKGHRKSKRKSESVKKMKHIEIKEITPKDIKLMPRPDNWDGRHVLMGTIYDLHNWVVRKGCIVPVGYRNTFCMIATTRFRMFNVATEDCIKWLENYLDEDFLDEAKKTVEYIYANNATISNAAIAKKLHFTSADYENSYLIYTEGQRRERRQRNREKYNMSEKGKKTNAAYCQKKKSDRAAKAMEKKLFRENRTKEILSNSHLTADEIHRIYGWSIGTINRTRLEAKKDSKNLDK